MRSHADLDIRHPVDEVTNIGLLVRLYKYIPNTLANLAGIQKYQKLALTPSTHFCFRKSLV